ncbi:hypothetical protein ACFO5R_01930 [Halosolutus amylolyticus]|uniref:ArsR family transcriptional regulator n=1 Tax=Halosolutus amylolyticus TaxID=2932267 RepID=A0ABD5PJU3_9EURY|nr:hypothetical protein [Halosolutus amylolyticus]
MADEPDDELTPQSAFSALASEVRVEILRTLGSAPASIEDLEYVPIDRRDAYGMQYSTLRKRVGVDDKGRFTYHLSQLTGTFVDHCDGRYQLNWLGQFAYRFLVAGAFSSTPTRREFETDAACPRCRTAARARYTDEQLFFVDCPDCDCRLAMVHVPGRTDGARSREALLDAAAQRFRAVLFSIGNRRCPWCAGELETTITLPGADDSFLSRYRDQPIVTVRCRDCSGAYYPTVGETLVVAPPVVSFLHRHGIDPSDRPPWEFPFAVDGDRTSVLERDPTRVAVTVRAGEDELTVVVDESLETGVRR